MNISNGSKKLYKAKKSWVAAGLATVTLLGIPALTENTVSAASVNSGEVVAAVLAQNKAQAASDKAQADASAALKLANDDEAAVTHLVDLRHSVQKTTKNADGTKTYTPVPGKEGAAEAYNKYFRPAENSLHAAHQAALDKSLLGSEGRANTQDANKALTAAKQATQAATTKALKDNAGKAQTALDQLNTGYDDGRVNKPANPGASDQYMIGYKQGQEDFANVAGEAQKALDDIEAGRYAGLAKATPSAEQQANTAFMSGFNQGLNDLASREKTDMKNQITNGLRIAELKAAFDEAGDKGRENIAFRNELANGVRIAELKEAFDKAGDKGREAAAKKAAELEKAKAQGSAALKAIQDGYSAGRSGKTPSEADLKSPAFSAGYKQGAADRTKANDAIGAALAQLRQDQANVTFNDFKQQEAKALDDKYQTITKVDDPVSVSADELEKAGYDKNGLPLTKTQVDEPVSVSVNDLEKAGYDRNGVPLIKTQVDDSVSVTPEQLKQAGYDKDGLAKSKDPKPDPTPSPKPEPKPISTQIGSKKVSGNSGKKYPNTGESSNTVAASVGLLVALSSLFGLVVSQKRRV